MDVKPALAGQRLGGASGVEPGRAQPTYIDISAYISSIIYHQRPYEPSPLPLSSLPPALVLCGDAALDIGDRIIIRRRLPILPYVISFFFNNPSIITHDEALVL